MEKHKVKRLPVIKDGQVVGMLTRSDFMKALGRFVSPGYEDTFVTDQAIVAGIRKELSAQGWAWICDITITSLNGVVTLEGNASSESQRRALIVVAEITDGVRIVHDRMDLMETVLPVGL